MHLVLAMAYGALFGTAVGTTPVPALATSLTALIVVASVYGLLLWLINFSLIASLAFVWFTQTNPLVQLLAHTLVYGAALGFYLTQARARQWGAADSAQPDRHH